jgi:hypothetical protein
MTQAQPFLCAAANVEIPAYLILSKKNYTVTTHPNDGWHAEKDGLRFQAKSLVELLGLIGMYEGRGTNWAATDQEIDDFLAKYDC